jgi:hypothetical protein
MLHVMPEDAIETLESARIRHVQAARVARRRDDQASLMLSLQSVSVAVFRHENRGNLDPFASSICP